MKRERLLELAGVITESSGDIHRAIQALAQAIHDMVPPGDPEELGAVFEEAVEELRQELGL